MGDRRHRHSGRRLTVAFLGCRPPALQIAAKELSRSMAAPHVGDKDKVVRIAECLFARVSEAPVY